MDLWRRTSPGRTPRRRRTLLLLAAAATLVLAAPSPALAHDGLAATRPADAATVAVAPATVELDFTGTPLPIGTEVTVTGPDGGTLSEGPPEIQGTTVVQPLAGDLAAGVYRVEWRSTSSDGHALTGGFGFSVTSGGSSAGMGGDPSPAAAVRDGSQAAGGGLSPVWPAAGAIVLVGLGAVLVARLRRRA